ncbi:conserved protein of unknown function [Aminobacter niigataensis]|nr:conserved protein of unknown function [Aminobacter niigataensis]
MSVQMETAPRLASESGGISKALTAGNYRITPTSATVTATEFAASIIAARFFISPTRARVVCELAQIGGRFA